MEANTKHHLKLSCLFTPLHCRVVKAFDTLWATGSSKRVNTAAAFLRIICLDKSFSMEYLKRVKVPQIIFWKTLRIQTLHFYSLREVETPLPSHWRPAGGSGQGVSESAGRAGSTQPQDCANGNITM